MRYAEALLHRHSLLAQWHIARASRADTPKDSADQSLQSAKRHIEIIGDCMTQIAEWNDREFGDCNATQKVKP